MLKKFILFFLICFANCCHASEEKKCQLFGVYDNVFTIDGFDFLYDKSDLEFSLIPGDFFLVTYEYESLPDQTYRVIATLTEPNSSKQQSFLSTTINDDHWLTVEKVHAMHKELMLVYHGKMFGGSYPKWCVNFTCSLELANGSCYDVSGFSNDSFCNKEDAKKVLHEFEIKASDKVRVVEENYSGYPTDVKTFDATLSFSSPSLQKYDIWGKGLASRRGVTQDPNPIFMTRFSGWIFELSDYVFNTSFKPISFEFLYSTYQDYYGKSYRIEKGEINDSHIELIFKNNKGRIKQLIVQESLYENTPMKFMRCYDREDGQRIFIFQEMERGCIIECIPVIKEE